MSDPRQERLFVAKLKKEIGLVSASDHVQQVHGQLRGLPSTRVPLSITVRQSRRKSRLGFQLPFVPYEQAEYGSDARCVLQIWELDRWRGQGRDDDSTARGSRDNELLGEIEGFIKESERRKTRRTFIFLTDQNPAQPAAQSDQNKGRIVIKLAQLQPGGRISAGGIDWPLNVSGEIENRLEIGISIRPKSKTLDFKNKAFPYPVVYLHKISEPPTEEEILHVWREKWKIWKRRKAAHPGWKLDCGVASHHVLQVLGGKRENTTLWTRTRSNNIWYSCTKREYADARERFRKGYRDKILSDVCYAYLGRPRSGNEEPDVKKIELKPGMRIYTAEGCEEGLQGRWNWTDCHMTMYAGNDKILDSVGLSRPEPRPLKPFYAGRADMFIVLRVLDPFVDMRDA